MRVNDTKSTGAGTVLLGITAIALTAMVGTISLIHQVGELGPKVGDILSFDPLDRMSSDLNTRVPAMTADDKPGVACALDVRAIHANGGSIVIEARTPRLDFAYRVHWSGPRTSNDGTNCGASADLLVNLSDIEVLAMAAGGYGVPASKHAGLFGQPAVAAE
jgi:hypothetical protein